VAECVKCGFETKLYVGGSPICLNCDAALEQLPQRKLDQAKAKLAQLAYAQSPQELTTANRLLAEAGTEYAEALRELLNETKV